MNSSSSDNRRRILIVDDNRSIHDDFRKILGDKQAASRVSAEEAELFGSVDATPAVSASS